MSGQTDYRVDLDTFRGPLDLLLYLVKRDEIDILDIPIAQVAEQFKQYLEVMVLVDVERAGDFLVMASTLMEIKSKLLLPRPEEQTEEEADPRRELVRQLIQYKRFKEASNSLEELAEQQSLRLARTPPPPPARNPSAPTFEPVELWDLVSAFGRLMRETLALQPQTIGVDHTPLHVHMDAVVARLAPTGRLSLSQLFTPPYNRSRLLGLFLAILELAKIKRIMAVQEGIFGEIWVTLVPEPIPATDGNGVVEDRSQETAS